MPAAARLRRPGDDLLARLWELGRDGPPWSTSGCAAGCLPVADRRPGHTRERARLPRAGSSSPAPGTSCSAVMPSSTSSSVPTTTRSTRRAEAQLLERFRLTARAAHLPVGPRVRRRRRRQAAAPGPAVGLRRLPVDRAHAGQGGPQRAARRGPRRPPPPRPLHRRGARSAPTRPRAPGQRRRAAGRLAARLPLEERSHPQGAERHRPDRRRARLGRPPQPRRPAATEPSRRRAGRRAHRRSWLADNPLADRRSSEQGLPLVQADAVRQGVARRPPASAGRTRRTAISTSSPPTRPPPSPTCGGGCGGGWTSWCTAPPRAIGRARRAGRARDRSPASRSGTRRPDGLLHLLGDRPLDPRRADAFARLRNTFALFAELFPVLVKLAACRRLAAAVPAAGDLAAWLDAGQQWLSSLHEEDREQCQAFAAALAAVPPRQAPTGARSCCWPGSSPRGNPARPRRGWSCADRAWWLSQGARTWPSRPTPWPSLPAPASGRPRPRRRR